MEENEKLNYSIIPKFNLLYEIGMPTGRKIRNTIVIIVLFIILTIIAMVNVDNLTFSNYKLFSYWQISNVLKALCIIALVFSVIKLIFHIIFQTLQYNHIRYRFYDTYMIYEDDFLNQHKKNILYRDIKEVEIRRTIWDRILNYGIIVIYTNADNNRNNGLVIYSIKDPKYHYDIIDNLIHNYIKKDTQDDKDIPKNKQEDDAVLVDPYSSNDVIIDEEEFAQSLKNINKE